MARIYIMWYIFFMPKKVLILVLTVCLLPLPSGYAGFSPVHAKQLVSSTSSMLSLPVPGSMVPLSPAFDLPVLKGIKVSPNDPFKFNFVLDVGNGRDRSLRDESKKLIKYFLAALTTPEKDLWVNLSPYEADRIVPDSFGRTEMGRNLLAQDYLLKQITASLVYPEGEIGKRFWKRVYEIANKSSQRKNSPRQGLGGNVVVNTFNKVWIVPDKAVIYENIKTGTAYVVESTLKVLTEQDYLATNKNNARDNNNQIIKDIVIPELNKEVNQGQNFAQLRQIYNSLILAIWYKRKIKDSILSRVYANKNKVKGTEYSDNLNAQSIYQRYLQAFKKGAYNYIKEEQDPVTQQIQPKKYFSGGMRLSNMAMTVTPNAPKVDSAVLAVMKVIIDPFIDHLKAINLDRNKMVEGRLQSIMNAQRGDRSMNRESFISMTNRAIGITFGRREPIDPAMTTIVSNPNVPKKEVFYFDNPKGLSADKMIEKLLGDNVWHWQQESKSHIGANVSEATITKMMQDFEFKEMLTKTDKHDVPVEIIKLAVRRGWFLGTENFRNFLVKLKESIRENYPEMVKNIPTVMLSMAEYIDALSILTDLRMQLFLDSDAIVHMSPENEFLRTAVIIRRMHELGLPDHNKKLGHLQSAFPKRLSRNTSVDMLHYVMLTLNDVERIQEGLADPLIIAMFPMEVDAPISLMDLEKALRLYGYIQKELKLSDIYTGLPEAWRLRTYKIELSEKNFTQLRDILNGDAAKIFMQGSGFLLASPRQRVGLLREHINKKFSLNITSDHNFYSALVVIYPKEFLRMNFRQPIALHDSQVQVEGENQGIVDEKVASTLKDPEENDLPKEINPEILSRMKAQSRSMAFRLGHGSQSLDFLFEAWESFKKVQRKNPQLETASTDFQRIWSVAFRNLVYDNKKQERAYRKSRSTDRRKIEQAMEDLHQEDVRITDGAIADKTGFSPARVRNVLAYSRTMSIDELEGFDQEDPNSGTEIKKMEDKELLDQLIAEADLTAKERQALLKHYYDDMQPNEIAQEEGVHRGTTGQHLSRAIHKLRAVQQRKKEKRSLGGIDLNPGRMDLNIPSAGSGIAFVVNPDMLARLEKADGFVPLVMDVMMLPTGVAGTRILWAFLGVVP